MEMEKCCLPWICEPSWYCPIVDLVSWFKYGCVIEITILAKLWALLLSSTVILMETRRECSELLHSHGINLRTPKVFVALFLFSKTPFLSKTNPHALRWPQITRSHASQIYDNLLEYHARFHSPQIQYMCSRGHRMLFRVTIPRILHRGLPITWHRPQINDRYVLSRRGFRIVDGNSVCEGAGGVCVHGGCQVDCYRCCGGSEKEDIVR
jgi:hypothetical protein